MSDNPVLMLFLPVALAVVMAGLGLHLTLADFRRVLAVPRAVAVALAVQVLLLPPVAFGLAKAFGLPGELALGLVLLAASPGGVTANLFSHLARGDVALNISLTAINSVLALLTLPLWTALALSVFLGTESSVPPPGTRASSSSAFSIDHVVAMAAVSTGLPDCASTIETTGNDGICTQAESTITSASAVFIPATIAGRFIGSCAATARLS